ncbi:MAG: DUF1489 family protein [Caulobacterales bacterium]
MSRTPAPAAGVHIVKLCVGAESIEDLEAWQARQVREAKRRRLPRQTPVCGTRAWPKRAADVLAGGSLYWVIKGAILVRQRIIAIDEVEDDHGLRCGLYLDAELVRTAPAPKRAFQGWRYLEPGDAPRDLDALRDAAGGLPDELRAELMALGAW